MSAILTELEQSQVGFGGSADAPGGYWSKMVSSTSRDGALAE